MSKSRVESQRRRVGHRHTAPVQIGFGERTSQRKGFLPDCARTSSLAARLLGISAMRRDGSWAALPYGNGLFGQKTVCAKPSPRFVPSATAFTPYEVEHTAARACLMVAKPAGVRARDVHH